MVECGQLENQTVTSCGVTDMSDRRLNENSVHRHYCKEKQ